MDFNLNDEQVLFKDAIDRFIAKQYSFEQRRQYQNEPDGWSRTKWSQLAEQGFLALPFDTTYGGLGYGAIETMVVMEALGRGLVLEPYLSTIVIAGAVLRAAASASQLEELVPQIASGDTVIVLATTEKQSRYALNNVSTCARPVDDGYLLNGDKIVVMHGDSADRFIVSARSTGHRSDVDGIDLFLIDANTSGVNRRAYRTQDGFNAADLSFTNVHVSAEQRIGVPSASLAVLERASEYAIAAMAAESVGAMQALLDRSVDYLKQRNQFGGPIGRFQALQHRAAEMLIELEQTRSMAIYAALMVDEPDTVARSQAMSSVKYQIGKSGRIVGQLAVQLHGGVGVSEENSVGHYFRRLTMMEALFGDCDFHLSRLVSGH